MIMVMIMMVIMTTFKAMKIEMAMLISTKYILT